MPILFLYALALLWLLAALRWLCRSIIVLRQRRRCGRYLKPALTLNREPEADEQQLLQDLQPWRLRGVLFLLAAVFYFSRYILAYLDTSVPALLLGHASAKLLASFAVCGLLQLAASQWRKWRIAKRRLGELEMSLTQVEHKGRNLRLQLRPLGGEAVFSMTLAAGAGDFKEGQRCSVVCDLQSGQLLSVNQRQLPAPKLNARSFSRASWALGFAAGAAVLANTLSWQELRPVSLSYLRPAIELGANDDWQNVPVAVGQQVSFTGPVNCLINDNHYCQRFAEPLSEKLASGRFTQVPSWQWLEHQGLNLFVDKALISDQRLTRHPQWNREARELEHIAFNRLRLADNARALQAFAPICDEYCRLYQLYLLELWRELDPKTVFKLQISEFEKWQDNCEREYRQAVKDKLQDYPYVCPDYRPEDMQISEPLSALMLAFKGPDEPLHLAVEERDGRLERLMRGLSKNISRRIYAEWREQGVAAGRVWVDATSGERSSDYLNPRFKRDYLFEEQQLAEYSQPLIAKLHAFFVRLEGGMQAYAQLPRAGIVTAIHATEQGEEIWLNSSLQGPHRLAIVLHAGLLLLMVAGVVVSMLLLRRR